MGEPLSIPGRDVSSRRMYVYAIALVAAFSEFIRGYDLSVISGAIIFLVDIFELNEIQKGFAVSCPLLGCIIGAPIGGWLADRLGRKNTLYLTAILYAVSAIGTALPKTILTFYIYRILGGVGVGFASVVAPMYIAEVSPALIRGRLLIVGSQLTLVIGAFISVVVTWRLSLTGSWRWMFGLEVVPVLFFFGFLFLVPKSPRWLAQKKRFDEARDVLAKVDGYEHADQEMMEIKESLLEEKGTYRELFQTGLRRALGIAFVLALIQQLSGVDTTMYYAPIIFQKAGIASATGAIGQYVIVNSWNVVLTVLSLWLIEKVGRRPLLLYGLPVMALGQVLMGICFHQELSPRFLLFCFFVSMGGYVLSIAPLFWVIVAEIFPTRVRAKAIALIVFVLWSSSFMLKFLFPTIRRFFEEQFGSPAGAFWTFAAVCLLGYLFCLSMVPETKGRSLEEIGRSWKKSGPGSPGQS